ncbi:TetR/AcrR family transcriptional regulator [Fodinicola feengrottensis]|uniref:TetR/AcrR family transcriptional regulator n=1 Tax=Fodinicola feengrottensis TaxID=435914 RepID=A0ABP4RTR3_9ACTN|nr:TetR family transcriptional regulator [Fodinicola feengrottensis]
MQANARTNEQGKTFTEEARRAQIVAAAIETIAEVGYLKASFSKIAKTAGLSSTGMISYHFAGKEDLLRAVVADVVRTASEYIQPRVRAESSYPAMLRARIESNVELLVERAADLRALVEILANAKSPDGEPVADARFLTAGVEILEHHLRAGQQAGEFGAFDPQVMAIAIQGSIDAVVTRHTAGQDRLDLSHCGRELADLFHRATRP